MTTTRIGKIKSVRFGRGGYDEAMIGVTFDLGSDKDSWGVGDFWGTWAMKRSERTQWTEEHRISALGEMVMRLNNLLSDAKVSDLAKLVGIPVEVMFDGNRLKGWRILAEAI